MGGCAAAVCFCPGRALFLHRNHAMHMPERRMNYEQAAARHPGCYLEVLDVAVDDTYPDHAGVPVARAPAIRVWPNRRACSRSQAACIVAYWLTEDE
jgi:hypothetical protein